MTSSSLRVLVAGGGVAGIEALLTLHALAGDRVEMTLADAQPDFIYRPMKVAEPFARGQARRHPLAEIARDVGARFVQDSVTAVDHEAGVALTEGGKALRFDALLLATGARSVPAYEHALTWDDRSAPDQLGGLLRDIEQGYVRRLAFVVPPGPGWPLPAYELALMTARMAWDAQTGLQITLITPEVSPLAVFGPQATSAVAAELAAAGVGFHGCSYAEVEKGHAATVVLHPGMRRIEVDRVVALPRLVGRAPAGVPAGDDGFLAVDAQCRVTGTTNVWAAGDGLAFPVKFGGLAAEQADAAAEAIAQRAGADVTPQPFRPVLRGQLLTGQGERFLRHAAAGGGGEGEVAEHTLWWPPSKVAGRRLAPYLAERDEASGLGLEPAPTGLAVQTDLTRELDTASA
ncbi:MAG: sulfide:quinone oxidoreductase [Solirubrobacteraceae bacterium]|jgi:sulfide:quinone oxidoreductase|nr:sulfide:quinone oxidoreductase [Solirubrobacteraceae bacterium]